MAAAEYYFGTTGAQQMQNHTGLNLYPPHQSYQQQQPSPSSLQLQQYSNTPPPAYAIHGPQELPSTQQYAAHQGGYPPPPHQQYPPQTSNGQPPYPSGAPSGMTKSPNSYSPQPQNGYLGPPLQPQRSHSQPPRVHFAEDNKYDDSDSSRSYTSDSDSSRRRRHRHRRSRRERDEDLAYGKDYTSRDLDRDYSARDYDRDYDSDRDRRHRGHRKERKNRDTFLGAGGGAIIGDALFPGLGTAAGLLLGGYGGRKHAEKRSRSEIGDYRGSREHRDEDGYERHRRHHDRDYDRGEGHYKDGHHRSSKAGSGWDPESGTFKMGSVVR